MTKLLRRSEGEEGSTNNKMLRTGAMSRMRIEKSGNLEMHPERNESRNVNPVMHLDDLEMHLEMRSRNRLGN